VPAPVALSAFVLTRNESRNIDRCLASLSFCDEIVVLDAQSEDDTASRARRFTERVWIEPWQGFSAQRTLAVSRCRGAWVLWIDADEVVTPELADSIRHAIRSGTEEVSGYWVCRRVCYLGRWMRHGGWGEDWVLRLFRPERARFSGARVHERVLLDGPSKRLAGLLEHYSYRDLGHHWQKIDQLSRLGAEEAWEEGRRARLVDLIVRPPARWSKMYLVRLGFLDGWRGLVAAALAGCYVFLKYARLKEKESTR
jgi:glycosyltransferase involved in cell wall biosynthesis